MRHSNKKCLITVVISVICMFSITGCSMSPTYYSKKEIKNYVRNVFGKEYKLTQIDENKHNYTFMNNDGFSFTVNTYTYNTHFDASETIFYDKGLISDYKERVLEYHANDIKQLLDKFDFNVDTSYYYYRIYVSDEDEFEPLADFISEMDHILAYSYNNDNIPANMSGYKPDTLMIYIYYENIEISAIKLSSNDDKRLESSQVYTDIEEGFVNCIKTGELNVDIDKELWYKYPAGMIDKGYICGEPLNTDIYDLFRFYYIRDIGTYIIINLDPFMAFEDTPYRYMDGALAYLVSRLGGTYSSVDWNEAIWVVDGVTWEASLHTNKDDTTYLEVSRNGAELELTDSATYEDNGSLTGRHYTIEDLELMLDLEIEIDQTKMTANITKK